MKTPMITLALILALSFAAASCGDSDNSTNEPDEIYLSFSGGGYHAQTAGAGWVMAVTDRIDGDVDGMMENVGAISSISGGTWFITLLAYSGTYLESLQAPDASSTYATSGSDSYFAAVMNRTSPPGLGVVGIGQEEKDIREFLDSLNKPGSSLPLELDWQEFVDDNVYLKDDGAWNLYAELKSETLDGPDSRNSWAESIPLLFTGSLLTQQPALSRHALLGANTLTVAYPSMSEHYSNGIPPTAAPLILAGMGSSSLDTPPLLPGSGSSSDLEATYSVFPTQESSPARYPAAAPQGGLGVLQAGSISSAAGGNFVDIPVMEEFLNKLEPDARLRDFTALEISMSLIGLAPAYKMGSPMTEITLPDLPNNPADLASDKVVRLADGGITDTSSVASIMTLLATNDLDDGFNLLFFDNRPGGFLYSNDSSTADPNYTFYTGAGVATLFGFKQTWDKSDKYSQTNCDFEIFCYDGVLPHVFNNEPSPGDYVYWEKDADDRLAPVIPPVLVETARGSEHCNSRANYLRYEVTTIDNPLFNVKGGKKGTLHVVVARAGQKSLGAPKFACFQSMVDWIHTQVSATAKDTSAPPTIGDHLVEALGL